MYQVTFSDQSMGELNKLDTLSQMDLVENITQLTPDDLHDLDDRLGRFSRKGKTFYRLRAGEYRIYFEIKNDIKVIPNFIDTNLFRKIIKLRIYSCAL